MTHLQVKEKSSELEVVKHELQVRHQHSPDSGLSLAFCFLLLVMICPQQRFNVMLHELECKLPVCADTVFVRWCDCLYFMMHTAEGGLRAAVRGHSRDREGRA